jgi:hypothetical protein
MSAGMEPTSDLLDSCVGKTVYSVDIDEIDDPCELLIRFTDGTGIRVDARTVPLGIADEMLAVMTLSALPTTGGDQ